MKKEKTTLAEPLFWITLAGNIIFALWITLNGIKEGFQGTMPEKAYVGLIGLLTINSILLIQKRKQQTTAQS